MADRCGIQLRYTEGDGGPRHEPGLRMRILEANQAAADKRTTSAGINGFPSARCFEPIPDKMPWERPNYCVAPVDNYAIDVYSDEDLNITRQLLSAQYLLLPPG